MSRTVVIATIGQRMEPNTRTATSEGDEGHLRLQYRLEPASITRYLDSGITGSKNRIHTRATYDPQVEHVSDLPRSRSPIGHIKLIRGRLVLPALIGRVAVRHESQKMASATSAVS